jgi:hypothetical protein
MTEQAYTTMAVAEDRIMLDSASWQAVLATVKHKQTFRGLPVSLAGGYLDGSFAWPASAWADLAAAGLPARSQVGITVLGTGGEARKARANDSEPGNDDPAEAAAWALDEHGAHHWPVIYCDRSHKPQVIAECAKRGLKLSAGPSSNYGLWVATLDGTFADTDGSDLRTQDGVVGIQYAQAQSPVHVAGQPPDLDVTLVVRASWRAPAAKPKTQDAYLVLAGQAGELSGRAVRSADGGKTWT